MPSSKVSGEQTCVLNTVHTLFTVTDAGSYVLKLDTANMAVGDELEVALKGNCRASDPLQSIYDGTINHAQITPIHFLSPVPVCAGESLQCTIKQTAGTGRAIRWNLVQL